MKRKLIIPIVLCLFAGLTVFNIGLANRPASTDTTLDLISVMVKAFDEGEGSGLKRECYSRWLHDFDPNYDWVTIYKCGQNPDDTDCYSAIVQRPMDKEECIDKNVTGCCGNNSCLEPGFIGPPCFCCAEIPPSY